MKIYGVMAMFEGRCGDPLTDIELFVRVKDREKYIQENELTVVDSEDDISDPNMCVIFEKELDVESPVDKCPPTPKCKPPKEDEPTPCSDCEGKDKEIGRLRFALRNIHTSTVPADWTRRIAAEALKNEEHKPRCDKACHGSIEACAHTNTHRCRGLMCEKGKAEEPIACPEQDGFASEQVKTGI